MLFALIFSSFMFSARALAQIEATPQVFACPKGPLSSLNTKPFHVFPENPASERYPPIMVLVSFSMPLESLKALGQSLKKVNGKLVFRGLYKNSFLKSTQKFRELGFEAFIDPTLFRLFKIEQVPAFILVSPSYHPPKALKGDSVSGHITLLGALEIFEKNKIAAATSLLKRLRNP